MQTTLTSLLTWQDEMRSALRTPKEVSSFFNTTGPSDLSYPVFIPISFAQKIKKWGMDSALAKQFIPDAKENSSEGLIDPIGDHSRAQASQIIHRYQNRVLFLPTSICPILCRYCFRKNELSPLDPLFKNDFQKTLEYLETHKEIEEVIFSGGDPFILEDEKLSFYLKALSRIPHIKYIRFHTRTPIILPSRFTTKLLETLEEFSAHFKKIIIVIHTNHEQELDSEVEMLIKKFKNYSLELLSQSVLLKNINDDVLSLKNLFTKLDHLGVRPYYLHHPDQVRGGMHFYLPIEAGKEIYTKLRQELSGWMLPQYVIDSPEAHGKKLTLLH
ncbi:MAG: KamA family radical SAM protein [Bacteriovoracaceae bacterium]|nr:KamA family radical SAM protein [Bacteriovoracaceae bacterium]